MFDTVTKWLCAPLLAAATMGSAVTAAHAADPSALWNIVDGKCVPDMREHNDPAPCSLVDLAAGYVILKDINGATQFLAMPTRRSPGIEDPAILAAAAPNYWDAAWRARTLTEQRAGKVLPREAVSLAINSVYGRSQNQLHIHIDCVRADVRDALTAHRDAIGPGWTVFPVALAGLSWRSLRIDGDDLNAANPFRLLAGGDAEAAADMGHHTLVVVGMTWRDGTAGFVLLDGKADLLTGNRGSGEMLQDHACGLAR